jgi:hypothetical protein
MSTKKRHCCYVRRSGTHEGTTCPAVAIWSIWNPDQPNPDDGYTDACFTHLPYLMTDAHEHHVYRIDQ